MPTISRLPRVGLFKHFYRGKVFLPCSILDLGWNFIVEALQVIFVGDLEIGNIFS